MALIRPVGVSSWIRTNVLGSGRESLDFVRPPATDVVTLVGAVGAGAFAATASDHMDKLQHGIACFTGTVALGAMGLPPGLSAAFTFAGATVLKEFLWDGYLGRGNFDVKDIAANLAGSCAGYAALKTAGQE